MLSKTIFFGKYCLINPLKFYYVFVAINYMDGPNSIGNLRRLLSFYAPQILNHYLNYRLNPMLYRGLIIQLSYLLPLLLFSLNSLLINASTGLRSTTEANVCFRLLPIIVSTSKPAVRPVLSTILGAFINIHP